MNSKTYTIGHFNTIYDFKTFIVFVLKRYKHPAELTIITK